MPGDVFSRFLQENFPDIEQDFCDLSKEVMVGVFRDVLLQHDLIEIYRVQ
jgi:hypothetical protein